MSALTIAAFLLVTALPAGASALTLEAIQSELAAAAALPDSSSRAAALDTLWQRLRDADRFPFVEGENVLFLYRGPARDLKVVGDFNGWSLDGPSARRLENTSVWMQTARYPLDARLDYKFVRDGNEWLLDPENPRRQRGGFGDNSVLAMPGYQPSPWVTRREGIARGTLSGNMRLASGALGYTVDYRVYVPPGDALELPSIYVTDGQEYAQDDMGSMVLVLDNLIAAGRIQPVLAVFIDPRHEGRNLRGEQYVLNEAFVAFVRDELVPAIDAAYPTAARRETRAILGTSLGGLNAAWFALQAPETFGLAAIQSPAFGAGDGVLLERYRSSPHVDVRMHMSWGTFHDLGATTEQMVEVLTAKGYDLTTIVTHEGHSWGQWRALLDDVLQHFWATEPVSDSP